MSICLDITGQKFNMLIAIKNTGKHTKDGKHIWLFKCECGNLKEMVKNRVTHGDIISCGCYRLKVLRSRKGEKRISIRGKNHYKFSGYEDITGSYLNSMKTHAKERNMSFFPNWDDYKLLKHIWGIMIQQQGKCALSGVKINFGSRKIQEQTASLDRKDSSKGYIKGNVQWIHKDIQIMKWNLDEKYFVEKCKEVVEYSKGVM
jgi:hypothetical protein